MSDLKKLYTDKYVNNFEFQDPKRINRLLRYLKLNKSDTILDIGCGDGALSERIGEKVKMYIGVDFSEKFIEKANEKRKANNIKFYASDVVTFCQETSLKFDKIFLLDFTEHVFDEELDSIISAAKEQLNSGGVIYIHTPDAEYFLEILKEIGILSQFPEHVAVRNAKQYQKLLSKHHFAFIEVNRIAHYHSFLKKFHFLSLLPFIGKYFNARLFITCG